MSAWIEGNIGAPPKANMMVANPLNDVNKFGLNLGADVCPPSEDAPQTFNNKNWCAHYYIWLLISNELKHLTIFLLNWGIYFTALIANTFDSGSRRYYKMAWKNYIPPTSIAAIIVFICVMNVLPLSVAFVKNSTECCETNGVPNMCLGFCFLAAEPKLLLRLGPCENHKMIINRCKLM